MSINWQVENKLWYIHAITFYYLAIKRNELCGKVSECVYMQQGG